MAGLTLVGRRILLCVFLVCAAAVHADPPAHLAEIVAGVERQLGARVGIAIADSGSDWSWGHRANERFPMNSTFKSILCGVILARVDAQTLSLDQTIRITADDILAFAPTTRDYVDRDMTVAALCYATLDKSDNTAANLLIDRLGGTDAVTDYMRYLGDMDTRLDRKEPEMNQYTPGDPRDTTTPAAMLTTWEKLLLGDALGDASRRQLATWMGDGWATRDMIRPSLPTGWAISDKSGGGRTGSRSLVALITPPQDAPYIAAIYISDTTADWDTRSAAIAEIGAAVIKTIKSR